MINLKTARYICFCKDMGKMVDFCQNTLGLKRTLRDELSENEWVEFGGQSFKICLHKSTKPGVEGKNRNKIVFIVDDVAKAREHLIAKKVKMGKLFDWKIGQACDGRDPEGNKFQISNIPQAK